MTFLPGRLALGGYQAAIVDNNAPLRCSKSCTAPAAAPWRSWRSIRALEQKKGDWLRLSLSSKDWNRRSCRHEDPEHYPCFTACKTAGSSGRFGQPAVAEARAGGCRSSDSLRRKPATLQPGISEPISKNGWRGGHGTFLRARARVSQAPVVDGK